MTRKAGLGRQVRRVFPDGQNGRTSGGSGPNRTVRSKTSSKALWGHSRTDVSNLTPLSHRFWSFLAWRYPLGRNSEIQNFLALGPLGGVLWAFQNLAIFGYQYFLNGHNFGSTKDRKLVLVSNIRFWDKLSEKSFQKFFLTQKKQFLA